MSMSAEQATATLSQQIATLERDMDRDIWSAYLANLRRPEAGEAEAFAYLIKWAMRLVQDDEVLRDAFYISRITLRRWAAGETVPGPMARDSVVRRLEKLAESKVWVGLVPV